MTQPCKLKFQLKIVILFYLFCCIHAYSLAQRFEFTRSDSLRGHLNAFRSCFDVKFYDLGIHVDPLMKSISGSNQILMEAVTDFSSIQLDLFSNMVIDSIVYAGQELPYTREGNAFYVHFPDIIQAGQQLNIRIHYHGAPIVAEHPPWEGGFIWAKDSLGRDWMAVSCEGTGASLWWPNKDHLSDEPDSMVVTLEIPGHLMGVSNGRLLDTVSLANGNRRWIWRISYPINNYNITLNIGYYSNFRDSYKGLEGNLDLDYWVLDYNFEKAREQFRQVQPMLECYEHYFGPYPFRRDGYKLVEAPYWGMEHQSGIAYGNNYQDNEFGFDYIIIHESAHEYWGNSVSVSDHGDMWVHESFATYAESLFMEYFHGTHAAIEYLEMQKESINNQQPIQGPLEVNYNNWPDADMYYKGSWMLHSLRHTINNDSVWFSVLKNLCREFKYQTITGSDLIEYVNANTEYDLEPIFDNYLNNAKAPVLKAIDKRKKTARVLKYKWKNVLEDFNMPVEVRYGQDNYRLFPTIKKQILKLPDPDNEEVAYSTELFYFYVR